MVPWCSMVFYIQHISTYFNPFPKEQMFFLYRCIFLPVSTSVQSRSDDQVELISSCWRADLNFFDLAMVCCGISSNNSLECFSQVFEELKKYTFYFIGIRFQESGVAQHWWWLFRQLPPSPASAASASLGTTPESLRTRQSCLKAVDEGSKCRHLVLGSLEKPRFFCLRWSKCWKYESPINISGYWTPRICSKNKLTLMLSPSITYYHQQNLMLK